MSALLYLPCQDMFGREVIVTPIVSQGAVYTARGILSTRPIDVASEEGVIISDQETILDVRDREFASNGRPVPIQGDLIYIPAEDNIPEEGDWEVADVDINGGGETTLLLRRYEAPTAAAVASLLESSLNPSPFGQRPIFTMTVAASSGMPRGQVRFSVDGEIRGYVAAVNGVSTWTPGWSMRRGNRTVSADFLPTDPRVFTRASATLVQTVQ